MMNKLILCITALLILLAGHVSEAASASHTVTAVSSTVTDLIFHNTDGDDDDGGFNPSCPAGMDHDDDDGDGDGGYDDDGDGYGDDDDGDGRVDCMPKPCPPGTVRDDNGDGYSDDDDGDGYGDDDDDDGYGDDRPFQCVPVCDDGLIVSLGPDLVVDEPFTTPVAPAFFALSLNKAITQTGCTVDVAINAQDGAPGFVAATAADYSLVTNTVTFALGELNKSIEVSIFGLEEFELEDEAFTVLISDVTNATVNDDQAVGVIKGSEL